MKLHHVAPLLVLAAGCGLVNSNTLSYTYAFDPPQSFMENFGDESNTATVPQVPCDPTASTDQCAALLPPSMLGAATLSCDTASRMCAAVVDVRLAYPVDLSMQSLPAPVVQYGIDKVSIGKIAYWIMNNRVNVEIPPIDLYVAGAAAKDETDSSAKLVGTVSKLPPKSQCTDPADPRPRSDREDARRRRSATCRCRTSARRRWRRTPRTTRRRFSSSRTPRWSRTRGDPVPTGVLSFYVRPTVQFSILK